MIASGGSTGGLFRAAWMESGSAFPSGDITKVQPTFDFITSQVNCTSASDKLACLRTVSTEDIRAAMDQTPTVISFEVRDVIHRARLYLTYV